jgi:hypothetical protein
VSSNWLNILKISRQRAEKRDRYSQIQSQINTDGILAEMMSLVHEKRMLALAAAKIL